MYVKHYIARTLCRVLALHTIRKALRDILVRIILVHINKALRIGKHYTTKKALDYEDTLPTGGAAPDTPLEVRVAPGRSQCRSVVMRGMCMNVLVGLHPREKAEQGFTLVFPVV